MYVIIKEEVMKVKKEKKIVKFPKDFFTKIRPHVTKKESLEDMIPFKWSDEVSNGKKKAILYSIKKNTN